MANTFSQIYIQTVFAVSGREWLIKPEFKEELFKYITGIVRNQKHKLIAVNGVSDHVHVLIGLRPSTALSDLVRDIKADSTNFINDRSLGKKVTARFLTATPNWIESSATFKTRKSIIRSNPSRSNT
jgi:REP element-mobilizing transposase RayT